MTIRVAASLLALILPGACIAGDATSIEDRVRVADQMQLIPQIPAGTLPNTCGVAPLPLTPAGPVVQTTLRYSTRDPVNVTAWRIPCSASESMIVLTLTPTAGSNPSFICQPRFQILQAGGLQTTAFDVKNDPSTISAYCADVVAPVTVAFVPKSSTPTSFDFDQGMTIDYDGLTAGHQTIAIPAFDPASYNITPTPGPHAIDVHVRGTASHYRNCTVSTATVGNGTQYTAHCASESPLKSGGFERTDY